MNTKNISSAAEIKDHLDSKAKEHPTKVLGELLWWSMKDVEVLQQDVVDLVDGLSITDPQSGEAITAKHVCPKLQVRGGLRKALAELNIKSGATRRKVKSRKQQDAVLGLEGRVLFSRRLSGEDDPTLGSGFSVVLVEETVAGGAVDWQEVQRITYSPETKKLTFTNDLLKDAIAKGFEKYARTYRAHECTMVINALMRIGHGIVAREAGGVFFLPRQTMTLGDALDSICSGINGADLTRFPVLDTEGASGHKQKTLAMAGKEIRKDLAKLEEELAVLKAKSEDPNASMPRGSTIEKRIDAYKVLRLKAKTYRDLLGMQDAAVKNALNALTRQAKALIQGNDAKREAMAAS